MFSGCKQKAVLEHLNRSVCSRIFRQLHSQQWLVQRGKTQRQVYYSENEKTLLQPSKGSKCMELCVSRNVPIYPFYIENETLENVVSEWGLPIAEAYN